MCAASWKRAAHTRSASIWHGGAIRSSGTRSTVTRNLSWDKAANVFTRGELTFVHPRTGERMTVRCDLPDYFTALLEKLGKR